MGAGTNMLAPCYTFNRHDMKKTFWLLLLLLFPMVMTAQTKVGYFSHDAVLRAMPGYAEAQSAIDKLRSQYDAETQRVEDEFNRKYEEFLEGQHEFPKTILQKRQTELQELMTRNVAFKEESRKQLADAEREALAPLKIRLAETVAKIASDRGLALVVNTASDACPYINPELGEDLNQLVTNALK